MDLLNKYTVLGIFIMMFGIMCIVIYNSLVQQPPPIEYRYLPPDLQTLMDDTLSGKDSFAIMNDETGPWIKAYSRQKMGQF
jgi:hypothetical protein